MSTTPTDTICYWIDAQDRIVEVNESWSKFALENGGEALTGNRILGLNLWSCMADSTQRELYRQLATLARQGRPVRFTYRCDAPRFCRLFEMQIHEEKNNLLKFTSTLKWQESRAAVPLLDSQVARNLDFVRVCSWCQRIAVGSQWLPVEAAVEAMGLMQAPTLPALTHGICEDCLSKMMGKIRRLQRSIA